MKIMIESMSKPLSRGVFWIVDDKILAFPFYEDSGIGVAKSGNTYNHKKLWSEIKPKGCNKPYNYYPRGRVDISNKGKAIIYLNPNISEDWFSEIRSEFGIREDPTVRYDYSQYVEEFHDKNVIFKFHFHSMNHIGVQNMKNAVEKYWEVY